MKTMRRSPDERLRTAADCLSRRLQPFIRVEATTLVKFRRLRHYARYAR